MGKTITTHFLEGTPRGIQSVQISNKNIMGFVVPRAEIKKPSFLQLEELASSPSLYVLIGETNDNEPQAYIGQTDDFLVRVDDHNKKKDFWSKALIFISQAGTLNKADILYLEYMALKLAKENNIYCLEANKQNPKEPKLQRHAKDTLQDFFADVQFITEFLNFNLFKSQAVPIISQPKIDRFYASRHCQAQGYYNENGFTVMKGSVIAKNERPSFIKQVPKRHALIERLIEKNNDEWVLKSDHTFNTPSGAADFCIGSSCNGWTEWKNIEGKTLDDVYRK